MSAYDPAKLQATYYRIGELGPSNCRRLLACAWWQYEPTASVETLRGEVREAFAQGAIAPDQVINELERTK